MFQHKAKIRGWDELEGIYLPARPFYPKEEDVYRALRLTALDQVKVVFVGIDPYHSVATADGLAFSTRLESTPRSLFEIKRELRRSLGHSRASNDLSGWAKQGVLLLNMALTVRPGEPRSHLELWNDFFREVLRLLRKSPRRHVWVLLGKEPRSYRDPLFINENKDYVLEFGHPSPVNRRSDFVGSDVFKKVNEKLKEFGHAEIDWIA